MELEQTKFLWSGLLLLLAWLLKTAMDLSFRVTRLEEHSSVRPCKPRRGTRLALVVLALGFGILGAATSPSVVSVFARAFNSHTP